MYEYGLLQLPVSLRISAAGKSFGQAISVDKIIERIKIYFNNILAVFDKVFPNIAAAAQSSL